MKIVKGWTPVNPFLGRITLEATANRKNCIKSATIMNSGNLDLAIEVRNLLERRNAKLVTAESCTAGRIAATLASIPGVSRWLCGGFVVYRTASKHAWLNIPWEVLNDPMHGPVSQLASDLLCEAAMQKTPEADWSLAITGDVGPGAPPSTAGRCFVAVKLRCESSMRRKEIVLRSPAPQDAQDISARIARLDEATGLSLQFLLDLDRKATSSMQP